MPDSHESRERLTRLEVQMENLTDQLEKAVTTIEKLTATLNELRGAFRGAMWLGGMITAALGSVAWAATWIYDKLGGGA